MLYNYTFRTKIISFFILLIQFSAMSQELFKDKNIDSSFSKYSERPREVTYIHLNKSTYIKNEDIGFTAYVFNKNDKKLSLLTKNLYCVIKDKNNKTVKEKLLKVENGIVNNTFKIDSLFTSGQYKFFGYTNWMKNFKEQNFFVQSFKVIDPEENKIILNQNVSDKIDAQFLPESGHLVANIKNTIGVIVKNEIGFGIPNIYGELLDDKNKIITSFKVNKLGIGRFSFSPESNRKYIAKIIYNDKEFIFNIKNIEQKGIILSAIQRHSEIIISAKTNNLTLSDIKNKDFKITLHNGKKITSFPINFNKKITISKVFKTEYLASGINVFTLFDKNNNPISERLIFNYTGINIVNTDAIKVKKNSDSLDISISYKTLNTKELNNVSISVLPKNTITYKPQHSIISYTYLQPYINGVVENAQYYFKNISNETKYYLDNLLITQGWSSYSWHNIFNHSEKLNYFFEEGITLKANINNTKKSKYVLYSINSDKPNYYVLDENNKEFFATNLFPLNNEKVKISKIEDKGKLLPAKLYPQLYPNTIPELNLEYVVFNSDENLQLESVINKGNGIIQPSLDQVQQVDEVIVKANLEKRRIEKIKNSSFGRVYTVNEHYRKISMKIPDFINGKGGYLAGTTIGGGVYIKVRNPNSTIHGGTTPTIYLNGMQLLDFSVLYDIDVSIVDYIDINKNGMGEGIRAGGGVIKIFTNPMLAYIEENKKTIQEFSFPLTFSNSKKYYTPKYQDYSNKFYQQYGVVDWLPINKINIDGNISFRIENIQDNNLKLFIEGFSNDGTFISETKEIILD